MGPLVQCSLAAVGTLACLALARRARRWRRVGDHPHCRRCDFDLFGLPDGATRCSECGADLTKRRAIAIGARRPARWTSLAATTLAIVCLAIVLWSGKQVEWLRVRARLSPTAWLLRDASHFDLAGYAAAEELDRRLSTDAYRDEDLIKVIGALRHVKVTARPTVRAGESLPVSMLLTGVPISGSPGTASPYVVAVRALRGTFAGPPDVEVPIAGSALVTSRAVQMDVAATIQIPATATPGPARLRIAMSRSLFRGGGRDDGVNCDRILGTMFTEEQPLGTIDDVVDLPITILPADADDIAVVSDAGRRASIQAAVAPGGVSMYFDAQTGRLGGASCQWRISLPTIGIAADVFIRNPTTGVEAPMGSITAAAQTFTSATSHSSVQGDALNAAIASCVDLVLRPSKDAARGSMATTQIWGEELVFPNVPVTMVDVGPTTRP